MLYALDKNGNRVNIDATHEKDDYFCPLCHEKLVLKKGSIRAHHFAHPAHSVCTDPWHYDMSEWHYSWQQKFPAGTQEVVMDKDGERHRADVFLSDTKTVIEFQHSPLSPDEFDERNAFYESFGYKVVWLFDCVDSFQQGAIETLDGSTKKFRWRHPKNTFNNFSPKTSSVDLFFQLEEDAKDNDRLLEAKSAYDKSGDFVSQDSEEYYENHKDDTISVVQVTWSAPSGFERFAIDDWYGENYFLSRYSGEEESDADPEITKEDLVDYLPKLRILGGEMCCYGCPLWNMGDPAKPYVDALTCNSCAYFGGVGDRGYEVCLCRGRFQKIDYSTIKKVVAINRNNEGFVTSFKYITTEDKTIDYVLSPVASVGKTLDVLWKTFNPSIMRCANLRTGVCVQVFNPGWQQYMYGEITGKIKMLGWENYSKNQQQIYGADKEE